MRWYNVDINHQAKNFKILYPLAKKKGFESLSNVFSNQDSLLSGSVIIRRMGVFDKSVSISIIHS